MHHLLQEILTQLKTSNDVSHWDSLLQTRRELGDVADLSEIELLKNLQDCLAVLPEKSYPYLNLSLLSVVRENHKLRLNMRNDLEKYFFPMLFQCSKRHFGR